MYNIIKLITDYAKGRMLIEQEKGNQPYFYLKTSSLSNATLSFKRKESLFIRHL